MTVAPTWSSAIGTLRDACARGRTDATEEQIVTDLAVRRNAFDAIVAAIRAIPDHERFLSTFSFADIQGAAGDDTVVYLSARPGV